MSCTQAVESFAVAHSLQIQYPPSFLDPSTFVSPDALSAAGVWRQAWPTCFGRVLFQSSSTIWLGNTLKMSCITLKVAMITRTTFSFTLVFAWSTKRGMMLHFLRERERKMSDCLLRTIAVTCLDAWRHADQTSGARWQRSVHISFVDQTVCLLSTHESIYPSDQYPPPRFWSRSTYASIAWDVSQKTLRYSGIWNKASNIWTWRSTTCWWRLWSWNVTHRKKAWMSMSRCGVELERG